MKREMQILIRQGEVNSLLLKAFDAWNPQGMVFMTRNERGQLVPANLVGLRVTIEASVDDDWVEYFMEEETGKNRPRVSTPIRYSLEPVEDRLIRPGGKSATGLDTNLMLLVEQYGALHLSPLYEALKPIYEDCPRYSLKLVRNKMKGLADLSKSYEFENDKLTYLQWDTTKTNG